MTDSMMITPRPHDPTMPTLRLADDRINLTHWLPSQPG